MSRLPSNPRRVVCGILIALACAGSAVAAGALSIAGGWTRPTALGANGAGYLVIANRGAAAETLTGAASPLAVAVSIHQSRMQGSVMTMRAVATLTIPAHRSVSFAPGGYHLMLEGLKRPLKAGDKVPVTLTFARTGALRVLLDVRLPKTVAPMSM
jgi:periplasmic copper chaperone A